MRIASKQVRPYIQVVDVLSPTTIDIDMAADIVVINAFAAPSELVCTLDGGKDGQVVVLEVDGDNSTRGITLSPSSTLAVPSPVVMPAGSSRLAWRRNGVWKLHG